jgi:hypothetical protein
LLIRRKKETINPSSLMWMTRLRSSMKYPISTLWQTTHTEVLVLLVVVLVQTQEQEQDAAVVREWIL